MRTHGKGYDKYSEDNRYVENYREETREYLNKRSRARDSRERHFGEDNTIMRGSKNTVRMNIVVPKHLVGHLSGKNNEILKVIQRKSKCAIRLDIDVCYYKHNRKMWI